MSDQQQQTQSPIFTCLACQIAFPSLEIQRNHYVTDWHRYNLKRKIVELPPVTLDMFTQKILAQQQKNQNAIEKENFSVDCGVCNKTYYSENAYVNHLKSNKHKVAAAQAFDPSSIKGSSLLKDTSDVEEDKEEKNDTGKILKKKQENEMSETNDETLMMDRKIETSIRLGDTDCLFCTHKSDSFDDNITHMTKVHSLFIPEIEYLVDIRGLIKYLGEKISVGNVCLYCNGRGKGFQSLEAVRKHMIDKGHTMIIYDKEEDMMEISDYYDFRSSYSDEEDIDESVDDDDDDDEWEDVDEEDEDELPKKKVILQNGMKLILPSGARIGHRLLSKYHRQNVRNKEENDISIIKLIANYANDRDFSQQSGGALISHDEKNIKFLQRSKYQDKRCQQYFDTRIGIKANKLQKHYRSQIM